jgi:hypothetical protein
MLPTRFAEFNPIVEVLVIKLNAPVTPHAGDGLLGDEVTERGGRAPDVFGRRAHVQQPALVAFLRRDEPLEYSLGDGVGERIQTLIAGTCYQ